MYYTIKEAAPWQKTVTATVTAEEVNTVFDELEERYRAYAKAPGFRHGKVMPELVRSQFKERLEKEVASQIMDRQTLVILSDIRLEPVTQMDMQVEAPVRRDQAFIYTFSFYYLPDFDVPRYEGAEVTELWTPNSESEVEAILENIRRTTPVQIAVTTPRKPKDGDVAVIDFEVREKDGSVCGTLHGKNVRVFLGDGGALHVFEGALKKVTLGEAQEEVLTLPENFAEPRLAGKTKTLYIKLHSLMERVPSQLDDTLARLVDPEFTTLALLRKAVEEELNRRKEASCRQAAEEQVLALLLEQTTIPLPEGMVERYQNAIIADIHDHMARAHTSLADRGRDSEKLAQEARAEAERFCQRQLLFLRVAKQEGILVTDTEISTHIRREASRAGVPYPELRKEYTDTGHILTLRDRLLAAKVLELLYRKAHVRREQVSA